MKIGIIFTAWQCADLLPQSLTPWVEARKHHLGGHDYMIAAVSVPFEGFPQDDVMDSTLPILHDKREQGDIDRHIQSIVPMKETDVRGAALRWLMTQGVDATIMVDADEFWTPEQIVAAFAFVEANPWAIWFRVCYKQLVFTRDQWLKEPFTPPRIHRTRAGIYHAYSFCDDNDIAYGGDLIRDLKPQSQFASMTVPQSQVWVLHDTWTNSLRSKAKVAYQNGRIGWLCDFAWDDARGGLVWRQGLVPPEVVHD